MSNNKDKNGGGNPDVPNLSELFGDSAKLNVTERDVFGGDLSALRRDNSRSSVELNSTPNPNTYCGRKPFNYTQFILIANLVVVTGILIYMVRRPAGIVAIPAAASADTVTPESADPISTRPDDTTDPATVLKTMDLGRHTTQTLNEAISLQTAEGLYAAREYRKAAYVYEQLRRNLTTRTPQDEALADWLTLQMALCLQKSQEQDLMADLFARATNSRSPAVRALTHYNLAFIQNHNRSFLEARRQAYQTLALLKTIEAYIPQTVEADCYFLAAEAMTRYLLQANNLGDNLPGILWSDSQPIHSLSVTNQTQLGVLLTENIKTHSKAVLSPVIEYDQHRSFGSQWSAYAIDGPLDQLLQQFASEAGINLNLSSLTSAIRQHKTNLFMELVDRNYLAEVAVGSVGMIWRFDGQTGILVDPAAFEDTDTLKTTMVQEAIAMWQRFLIRYRGDHRTPNVHYCLGQLYTIAEQSPTSLGEYKLLATQYPNNPLAPYALLGSSRIKTNLRDYTGAQTDLNELLIRYPNAQIMDEALLYLAEATMNNGSYAEAKEMFLRVYHLNVSREARRRSAFGLGKCAYSQQLYTDAVKWLDQTLTLITDKKDKLLSSTCYMLGKAYIQTGRFVEAANTLRMALDGNLANSEYVQIILELANAETRQERFWVALKILESIPESRLNQEDSVAVMIAKARLYRQIDVPSAAISLLRRKIQFIAESELRAQLSLELAECYMQNRELTPARNELNDAIQNLPTGRESQRAVLLLARIARLNLNNEQAESLCKEALKMNIYDETLQREIYDLLGMLYTEQQAYDRAALAYAGLLEQRENQ